ncbi:hypothetical protein J4410_04320 [Candidatus Woesearchaeota archaeon]|nr:hypothetical protein [Candidatus Woesearchaeota archaeon]
MYLTPLKNICLRFYCITLGRIPFFSFLLKRFLLTVMVKDKKKPYCSSANFFDISYLEKKE